MGEIESIGFDSVMVEREGKAVRDTGIGLMAGVVPIWRLGLILSLPKMWARFSFYPLNTVNRLLSSKLLSCPFS